MLAKWRSRLEMRAKWQKHENIYKVTNILISSNERCYYIYTMSAVRWAVNGNQKGREKERSKCPCVYTCHLKLGNLASQGGLSFQFSWNGCAQSLPASNRWKYCRMREFIHWIYPTSLLSSHSIWTKELDNTRRPNHFDGSGKKRTKMRQHNINVHSNKIYSHTHQLTHIETSSFENEKREKRRSKNGNNRWKSKMFVTSAQKIKTEYFMLWKRESQTKHRSL